MRQARPRALSFMPPVHDKFKLQITYKASSMSLTIKRISRITTAIELSKADLSRLKDDLETNEFLDEMEHFETLEELVEIIEADPNAASLVFQVLINSPGYASPTESFSDDSDFSATFN
jgi:hypothetical protein